MRSIRFFPRSQKGRRPEAGNPLLRLSAAVLILFLVFCPDLRAQQPLPTDDPESYRGAERLYQTLTDSFEEGMAVERQDLERVSKSLETLRSGSAEVDNRLNQIQLMISTYSNLLLLPSVDARELEQARTREKIAVGYIQEQIQKNKEELAKWEKAFKDAGEQLEFYENQRLEIQSQPPQLSLGRELTGRLDALIDLLKTKKNRIAEIIGIYNGRQKRFNSLLETMRPLAAKTQEQIEARKKSRIFQHDPSPILRLLKGELRTSMAESLEKIRNLISYTAWRKPGVVTWEEYSVFLSLFLSLFALFQIVVYGMGRYLRGLMQQSLDDERFWHYLFIKLIEKSLPLAAAIAFLYFFPLRSVFRLTPVFALLPLIIRILALIMVVRWGRIFLKALGGQTSDPLFHRIYSPLRPVFWGIAAYGVGHLLISRMICSNCMILIAWRMIFEVLLLAWCVYFSQVFRRASPDSEYSGHRLFPVVKAALIISGCFLVLPGFLAEVTGFGGLAMYWYFGWAKTAVLVFWVFVLYQVLRESDVAAYIERSDEIDADDLSPRPYPVRWLIVRLLRIGVFAGALFVLFLAWGAPKTFLIDILYAINYEFTIGDFRLSLMGFVYALIVLLFVHTFTVVSKEFLRSRVLQDADMETGLKDSILRITGYVFWTAGILIALRTVGISGTALTVVFGAVGIGLGFGLQNIFNNFLSGIILLFERPIQVGDVIEIGDIWGTVREINVRSTQMRTFDNAELIIPNADLISQVVTNWSYRDARIRRTVQVRVAYGSDVGVVRQVLMDVAYQHPRVLRTPHPEVLFSDFEESALIFKLRFWVHIDWFLTVETDVRSDIDKQFKLQGITIPFPQRDVYLKTGKVEPPASAGAQEQDET